MGFGHRVFIIHQDGSINRFPFNLFEDLHFQRTKKTFKEFAGKRIKYAFVRVLIVHRQPVKIEHIEFGTFTFDKFGKLDKKAMNRAMHLAVNSLSLSTSTGIDIDAELAQINYQGHFKWKPDSQTLRQIEAMALL